MGNVHVNQIPLEFSALGAWLIVGLLFVVGAVFGSFFNVVAYRLPRGMSLSSPGSHCPACRQPIRWHDNIPILGWLILGGRCRACRARISPRYPLVELMVGLVTAIVGHWAIVPAAEPGLYTVDPLLMISRLLFLYALVCAALLEFDKRGAPLKLLGVVLATGVALAIVWPDLRLAAGETVGERMYGCGRALAAALLLGLVAWPLLVEQADRAGVRNGAGEVIELALVAVFMGVTAVAVTAVFAATWCLATSIVGRLSRPVLRFGWAAALVVGTLIWIPVGGEIAARWLPSGGDNRAMTLAAAGAMVAALSVAARAVRDATDVGRTRARGDRTRCD